MGAGKKWTDEEAEFLIANWQKGKKYVSGKIGRSEESVRLRAKKMGLGGVTYSESFLSFHDIAKIVGVDNKTVGRWRKKGLKFKLAPGDLKVYRVTTNDLETFLKDNQNLWDGRKLKYQLLWISKPEWFKEKLEFDNNKPKRQAAKWTKEEDQFLIKNIDKMKQKQIAEELSRTEGSVQRRLSRLREKRIAPAKKIVVKWTDEEVKMLLEMDAKGMEDKDIAWELGREKMHISDKRRCMKAKGEYPAHKNHFRQQKETEKIVALLEEGLSQIKIAKELGIHPATVWRRLKAV